MNTRMLLAGLLMGIATAAGAADPGDKENKGNKGIVLRDAWIRAAPPTAPVMAGYVMIENRTRERRTLTGASSPLFADIAMHRTEEAGGVVRMTHQPRLELAPFGELAFRPGGYHLMLAQAKRALRLGEKVPIELAFADGTRVSAMFVVREQPGTAADDHSHAMHTPTPGGGASGHRH